MQQLRQQVRKITAVVIERAEIETHEGETFLGAILNDDGSVHHYAIKLPDAEGDFDWVAADDSAKARGGHRPSRAEGHLIHARMPGKVKRWFWLDEEYGSDYAWYCFSSGTQYGFNRSAEGAGVAVRRVFPSTL